MCRDDAKAKRIAEILEALKNPDLPEMVRARLERELERIGHVFGPSPKSSPTADPLIKPPIDLEAIYTRRAELDFKLFAPKKP
jgi:hypothetical protein